MKFLSSGTGVARSGSPQQRSHTLPEFCVAELVPFAVSEMENICHLYYKYTLFISKMHFLSLTISVTHQGILKLLHARF